MASYDYEYERNGVSGLFMLFAPLESWRRIEVGERSTKVDWARVDWRFTTEDARARLKSLHPSIQ